MSRTAKVFLACALGAFIGTLVALQVSPWLWWVGLAAGSFVGYFAYDFRRVIEAIPVALHAATSWRPDWENMNRYLKSVLYFWFILSVTWPLALVGLNPGAATIFTVVHRVNPVLDLFLAENIFSLAAVAFFIGLFGLAVQTEELRHLSKKFNFFRVYFWHVPRLIVIGAWRLLQGGWWLVVHIPAGLRAARTFSWALFKAIHSDERLLCIVDAAIGTVIGYWAGNAAIGGIVGGLVGVANYEILSKRILKLVPLKS